MTTVDIFTLPLPVLVPCGCVCPPLSTGSGGGARAGGPGTQHLVISQSAAAHQNNVEAIRVNCALMAPFPLSVSNWLEHHLRLHTHTQMHPTYTNSPRFYNANIHNRHQLNSQNNIQV